MRARRAGGRGGGERATRIVCIAVRVALRCGVFVREKNSTPDTSVTTSCFGVILEIHPPKTPRFQRLLAVRCNDRSERSRQMEYAACLPESYALYVEWRRPRGWKCGNYYLAVPGHPPTALECDSLRHQCLNWRVLIQGYISNSFAAFTACSTFSEEVLSNKERTQLTLSSRDKAPYG